MASALSQRSRCGARRRTAWHAAGIVAAALIVPALYVTIASAQTATSEADVTVGHSTQDVDAAATQARVYGELKGWRYYGDVTWAARRGEDSDAFGAAYPYEPELQLMEAFGERTECADATCSARAWDATARPSASTADPITGTRGSSARR